MWRLISQISTKWKIYFNFNKIRQKLNFVKFFRMLFITERNFHFWNLCLQTLPIRIGPSQYGCPICQNIQRTSWHAKRHISTHFNDRPFSCQFCNYSTNRKDNLKFHMAKCNKIFKAERDFWIPRISLKYILSNILKNIFTLITDTSN